MNIVWTKHAVQRCWTRMKLSDSDKSMDLFDEKIKDNLKYKVKQEDGSYHIAFKVAGQCYMVVGAISYQNFVIKTFISISLSKFKWMNYRQNKPKKKEWINERVK